MPTPGLKTLALAAPAALIAAPGVAQSVTDCDTRAGARFLAEPWEDNTATFAEGAVRIAVIDMMEPAGAPAYLMILSPPRNEIGERQCRIVEAAPHFGFYTIELADTLASYDPERGLTLRIPVTDYTDGPSNPPPFPLTVTINQSTGDVSATID
ncbi:hypothetical protein [Pseudooceanicola sp. LIPI14-2-Ac024]|uniref:hypothetical protein n=1 Tax=Pseudooceanicola sp. LIPI14-2-Ac024 TaxID=3344875 RepID=UPI0035CF91FC